MRARMIIFRPMLDRCFKFERIDTSLLRAKTCLLILPNFVVLSFPQGGCRAPDPPAKRPSARWKINKKRNQIFDQKSIKNHQKIEQTLEAKRYPRGRALRAGPLRYYFASSFNRFLIDFWSIFYRFFGRFLKWLFIRPKAFLRGVRGGGTPPSGKTQSYKS